MISNEPNFDHIAGTILGCAVGDAIGLPYEGLTRRRAARLLGEPDRHRFIVGRGMVSDDTEHTCMVAQSLCEHPTDPDAFARALARRMRWWLLGIPAGIGFATLRSILKLWLGFPPNRSGVFSAGNGPAMRSAILGAAISDLGQLQRFVRASTRITHTDPKAEIGAYAVAFAAHCAHRGLDTPEFFFEHYREMTEDRTDGEFHGLMSQLQTSLREGESTELFSSKLCGSRGVSGYVYHTVPVCIHAWLSHAGDFRSAVTSVIRCGGDADTTAAIVGGIVGCGVGRAAVPREWVDGLWEWSRRDAWMLRLAESVELVASMGDSVKPPTVWPPAFGRNILFAGVVILHGMRRLLPPY